MAQLEHRLQTACATFLSRALPADATFCGVDQATGQKLSRIVGAMRKARGLKTGWPDMQIIYQGKFFSIELKVGNNTPRESQRRVAEEIVRAGGGWLVCRSIDEVERALRGWGIPLRATSLSTAEIDARLDARAAAPKKPAKARKEPADRKALNAMARARKAGVFR